MSEPSITELLNRAQARPAVYLPALADAIRELVRERDDARAEVEKRKERIRNANNAYAKLWDEVERLRDALDQFVAWELGQLDHPVPTRKEIIDMAMAALAGGKHE